MTPALRFRPAAPADSEALRHIRHRAILGLAPPVIAPDDAARWADNVTPQEMSARIAQLEIWVAMSDERIIGWASLKGHRLEGLYRDPDPVWRGTGTALLAHVEQSLRRRGLMRVEATAAANALGFYLRRGYVTTAPREPDGTCQIQKTLQP